MHRITVLLAAVTAVTGALFLSALAAPAPALAQTADTARLRVMVLYFDNNTGDADYDLLRKGMADMLITDLAQVDGIEVVERDRLEALIAELSLQRSQYFASKTALKLGKMVGATHAVAGSFAGSGARVRIDVRLIDVAKATVLATDKVQGKKRDFFDLQQRLAGSFSCRLVPAQCRARQAAAKAAARLPTLMRYSTGLDQADRGQLEQASRTMRTVMQNAPTFAPAKASYARIMRRLYAAKEQRQNTIDRGRSALEARATQALAGLSGPVTALDAERLGRRVGYRVLLGQLVLRQIDEQFRAWSDAGSNLGPAEIKRFTKLVDAYVGHQRQLLADIDAYKRKHPGADLPDATIDERDAAQGEKIGLGREPGVLSFYSTHQIRSDLGGFLATGVEPYWGTFRFSQDIALYQRWRVDSRVRVKSVVQYATVARPPMAQIHRARLQSAGDDISAISVAMFEQALRDIRRDVKDPEDRQSAEISVLDAYATALEALGHPEDAIARWQTILERYPTYDEYHLIEGKIKAALGIGP